MNEQEQIESDIILALQGGKKMLETGRPNPSQTVDNAYAVIISLGLCGLIIVFALITSIK